MTDERKALYEKYNRLFGTMAVEERNDLFEDEMMVPATTPDSFRGLSGRYSIEEPEGVFSGISGKKGQP